MKIAFRVDASVEIGTGHVVRCLTLADALTAKGAKCLFVMRQLPGNMIDAARARGHDVSVLPPPTTSLTHADAPPHARWLGVDWENDVEDTKAALSPSGKYDWLVVDHYALDARWERQLRAQVQQVLIIDDLADRPHECDLLLDQNLQEGPSRYHGLVSPECLQLVGPRYALLRPTFRTKRQESPPNRTMPVRRLLVFLGGIDLPGITPRALAAVEAVCGNDLQTDVVVGPANPKSAEIEAWCSTRDWVHFHPGNADMAELMAAADVAIGAGGTALWERSCLLLPTLLVTIADNQVPGANAVGKRGAALYLGNAEDTTQTELIAAIRIILGNVWLRQHMADMAGELVDGKGVDRVVAYMTGPEITLRRAEATDCDSMWQWRNAETVRRHFHDSRPVDLDTHRQWFSTVTQAKDRDLLVGELADEAVGVIRFDHHDDVATVSIYLVPGREGRGEGSQLLQAGCKWLSRTRPDVKIIEAEVLNENTSSHRAFIAAGFSPFVSTYRRVLDPHLNPEMER